MLMIRFGGNVIKVIAGVLLFIAGQMVVDARIVREKLLLKPVLSLDNNEQRGIIKILGKSSVSF